MGIMVSHLKQLIEEADSLLENNEFAAARDLYRSAVLLAPPTEDVLGKLRVAEEQDQLQFSRNLRHHFPASLVVQKNEIRTLMQMGNAWNVHALMRCTELLEAGSLELPETLHIRWRRLKAAIRAGRHQVQDQYRTLIEDFFELWDAGTRLPWAMKIRSNLVEELAGLIDPLAIETLTDLSERDWAPSGLKEFLNTKIRELHTLERVRSK